jgi:hypothetical protein
VLVPMGALCTRSFFSTLGRNPARSSDKGGFSY